VQETSGPQKPVGQRFGVVYAEAISGNATDDPTTRMNNIFAAFCFENIQMMVISAVG
jgi:hypothetical protein